MTEKSKILKEHTLRQFAGWTIGSNMPQKYLHYFGNEASESLLEAYGIITKDQKLSDALRPKQCPNCNEPNKPDGRFCAKCRMVLMLKHAYDIIMITNIVTSILLQIRKMNHIIYSDSTVNMQRNTN